MKKSEEKTTVFLLIVAVLLVIAYLLPIRYAMPALDDFSYATMVNAKSEVNSNPFAVAWSVMKDFYMNWQGNYFGCFLGFFVMNFWETGIIGMRIFLVFNVILFLIALFCIIKVVCSLWGKEDSWNWALLIYVLSIFVGMSKTSPDENLYWVTTACVYTIPFSFALLGSCAYIKWLKKKTPAFFGVAVILGFLAAGGVLLVAALINVIYLICWLEECWSDKSFKWKCGIPWFVVFAGALINTIAPGNYVRHDVISSDGFRLGNAIVNTLVTLYNREYALLRHSFYIWACLLVFVVVLVWKNCNVKLKYHPIVICMCDIIIMFIITFPVALGYNDNITTINRVLFILDILLALLSMFTIFYITMWMKEKYSIQFSGKSIYAIVGVLLITLGFNFVLIPEKDKLIIPTILEEISSGKMKAYSESEQEILDYLNETTEDYVVVSIKSTKSKILNNFELSTDPNNWVNLAMADFYGKESIRLSMEVNE